MNLKSVLWVVATGPEAQAIGISDILSVGFYPDKPLPGQSIVVTGVGMLSTAHSLTKILVSQHFDLIVNVGVCGSFRSDLPPGTVVEVTSEELGDFGAEDNGNFLSAFDLGFISDTDPLFKNRALRTLVSSPVKTNLPEGRGVTVNTVHGSSESIRLFKERCSADVESMEGAAVFFVAADFRIPVIQLRAVSNFVEPRNRETWKMKEALVALKREVAVLQSKITMQYS